MVVPGRFAEFRVLRIFVLLLGLASACSCGYRVRSSAGRLPSDAQSLGIPTFQNLTTQYKIEQLITRAVLKEFSARTQAPVRSGGSDVDLVLLGEIRSISSLPITFGTQTAGSQTYGSAFQVTVQLGVTLKRLRDSAIIWQNQNLIFRERYVMNGSVKDFFSEENPALERLARDFAATLASSVLDR